MILRYLFFIVVMVPSFLVFYFLLEMQGVSLVIFACVVGFQEVLVFVIAYLKIHRSNVPLKVQYLENKFGPIEVKKEK